MTVQQIYCKLAILEEIYVKIGYRIYAINRLRRLLKFWTLRVGAYSRLGVPFRASVVSSFFGNKAINGNNKTRGCNKARFL